MISATTNDLNIYDATAVSKVYQVGRTSVQWTKAANLDSEMLRTDTMLLGKSRV